MYTQEIHVRADWEAFIDAHAYTTFMQSWEWGEFEESCGHKVYRFGCFNETELIAVVQAILIRAKKGTFLYVPHGPILKSSYTEKIYAEEAQSRGQEEVFAILRAVHDCLLVYARNHRCHFIRLNSSLPKKAWIETLLKKLSYRKAPLYLTSENAAYLELSGKTPEKLLQEMRKTTRYLIQKASREGVVTTIDNTEKSLEDFMELYNTTTAREKFVGFSEEYIKKEFEAFHKSSSAYVLTSYYKNEPLASALLLFTKKSAFYHQGASNHPKVPAPYALQWEGIQLALKRGCKFYNFWGTYIPKRTPKSWQGLTLFKTGFGTHIWEYLPTYDYVLHPFYYVTFAFELLLRKKRGV